MNATRKLFLSSVLLVTSVSISHGSFRILNIETSGLAGNPNTGALYATRPGTLTSGIGNRLAEINTQNGAIIRSTFVGSEPGQVELTESGNHAFVVLNGAAAFTRVNLGTFSASPMVSQGLDPNFGPLFISDLAIAPGSEETVAVSRRVQSSTIRFNSVAIYDGAVRRVNVVETSPEMDEIEFGSSSNRVVGLSTRSTPTALTRALVNSNGVAVQSSGTIPGGANRQMRRHGGFVVLSTGQIYNSETLELVATLPAANGQGLMLSDLTNNRLLVLSGSGSSRTLTTFSMSNFTAVSALTVTGVVGTPTSLVQYGPNSIAFRTPTQVFLANTATVPEPATLTALGLGCAVALKRRRLKRN